MSKLALATTTSSAPVLRRYQQRDLRDIVRRLRDGIRLLYVSFMGSGKTVVASKIVQRWVQDGEKVLILVHRSTILKQTDEKFLAAGLRRDQVGFIWRNHPRTNPSCQVQIASLDTLARRPVPRDITRIVIDEAHHAPAPKWQKVLKKYRKVQVLGLTATPERLDGKPLRDCFDDMVEGELVENLIEDGYIERPEVWTRSDGWRPDRKNLLKRSGDYRAEDAAKSMRGSTIVGGIYKQWKALAKGRPTIGFAATLRQIEELMRAGWAAGVACERLSGHENEEERRAILSRLAAGKTKIVWTCDVLSEGWDFPLARCAILACPTASLARYLQWCGRVMRPGKPSLILDHAGNYYEHGMPWWPQGWSLLGREPVELGFRVESTGQVIEADREPRVVPGSLIRIADRRPRRVPCLGVRGSCPNRLRVWRRKPDKEYDDDDKAIRAGLGLCQTCWSRTQREKLFFDIQKRFGRRLFDITDLRKIPAFSDRKWQGHRLAFFKSGCMTRVGKRLRSVRTGYQYMVATYRLTGRLLPPYKRTQRIVRKWTPDEIRRMVARRKKNMARRKRKS